MDRTTSGWINGLLGVLIFSGSLPATRLAMGGFDPLYLTAARAAIAGGLALVTLAAMRQPRPALSDIVPLLVVAGGVVLGFPLLSAMALRHIDTAHSIMFTGLLPLATAIFAVLRGGERPAPAFWLFAALGSAAVTGFALRDGAGTASMGDALMLAAILVCGLGYAEGAVLARRLGGWQVICWALVLALPAMIGLMTALPAPRWTQVPPAAWAGLAYVALFSMLIGFVFWYRGLALGGIASVGQLQLLQPLCGLALAAILIDEPIGGSIVAITIVVAICVAAARHFAKRRPALCPARSS
ncbi:DMT family transporter [Edaphosphingomonas haloaromaticamans]|uniref:EamA-like transporter family protein n=1 Tax=Edaphosphingomonas haloaromaticamans TaxID=653954 RepID=A0A1S1HJB1_9SPHN|nr:MULTISPECIES: DMT family transporter [Sphingomonas]MDX3883649.1 DMT family transporter [Sphingomonas sp.]OHT21541.1 EamA-like transporter family protein [Sphingomonas haloaromaticamans]